MAIRCDSTTIQKLTIKQLETQIEAMRLNWINGYLMRNEIDPFSITGDDRLELYYMLQAKEKAINNTKFENKKKFKKLYLETQKALDDYVNE